jgi:hypothetical protein
MEIINIDYEILADICLRADGGYCKHCAYNVAEGFAEKFNEIDLITLKKVIDFKMNEYYKS